MSKIYKLGVIGAGMWGTNYLEMLQNSERINKRAQVTWICSATQASIDEAMQRFQIANGTLSYQEILKDPEVDAVVVTSPPKTHIPMGIATLQAGKHLLMEKPLAPTLTDVERLLAEAQKHPQQVILECSCRHARLQPKYKFVKNFIQSGKLGTIYHIHYNFLVPETFIEYNPHGAWAMRKETAGGGPFIDFGVYEISFHLGVLGDRHNIREIHSFHRNDLRDLSAIIPDADVEQHGAAYLEFDRGLTFYIERGNGAIADVPCYSRIYGTKGSLYFSWPTWTPHKIEHFYLDEKQNVQKESFEVDMSTHPSHDNIALIEHFLDCLDGTAKPAMTLSHAAKHLDILFRILK